MMADTVEGLVKRLRDASDGWSGNAWAVDAGTADEAASALEALVVERDEARRLAQTLLQAGQEDLVLMTETASTLTSLRSRAEAAEAQRDKLQATLFMIAHSFTEDSHGGTKTLPAHEYQDMARSALADMGEPA